MNNYDFRWDRHPSLSWGASPITIHSSQVQRSSLKDAMDEMENIKAQMATSHLKEAIAELARSQVENASLSVEMENYQAEIIKKNLI